MMDTETKGMGRSTIHQKIPLILHTNLLIPSFTDYLGNEFKIRVSDSIPEDTAILPSGVGVLVTQLTSSATSSSLGTTATPTASLGSNASLDNLVERARVLMRGHRVGVIILIAAMFGKEEIEDIVSELQIKLLPSPPIILPAHGHTQAATHLKQLSSATGGEKKRAMEERVQNLLQSHCQQTTGMHKALGLSSTQWKKLMEQFGSVGRLAKASSEEIATRTGLSLTIAANLLATLSRDTVTI